MLQLLLCTCIRDTSVTCVRDARPHGSFALTCVVVHA